MKRFSPTIALGFILAGLAGQARAGLVIGGWDTTRNGLYAINGAGSTQLDADLAAKFPTATITSTGTLTSAYLSTINILVIGDGAGNTTATTALSASEQTALLNFVKGGGSAIITVDNDTFQSGVSTINNSYVSPFGLNDTGTLGNVQTATATTSTGPIMDGPFGLVSNVSSNYPGYFDILGSNATSLANLTANGEPLIAEIAPGALGIGSGGVLFASDSILIDGRFNQADNTTLFNNAIGLFSTPASVPEPSSLALAGVGLMAGLAWSARSARRRGPSSRVD